MIDVAFMARKQRAAEIRWRMLTSLYLLPKNRKNKATNVWREDISTMIPVKL